MFVYDVVEAEWVQTVAIKALRPLAPDGALVVSQNAVESAWRLIYMRQMAEDTDRILLPDVSPGRRFKAKRKFSLKSKEDSQVRAHCCDRVCDAFVAFLLQS